MLENLNKNNKNITFLVIAFLMFIIVLWVFLADLPSIDYLETYSPSLTTKIYDINNELINELFIEKRTIVPLSDIPVDMQNAVIASEDTSFFRHWGIDSTGIIRSLSENLLHGRTMQGGSTITMQLARGLFLSRKKTYVRKIREALLALKLEINYSKEEILELYLNQIFLGHDIYGVEAAARGYFGKHINELTLPELTMIAGLIPSPNRYSPFNDLNMAFKRRKHVLSRMRKEGFITEKEENEANAVPIRVESREKIRNQASYFLEWIRQQLEENYGSEAIYKGGLEVYTTLDLNMQKIAQQMLEINLNNFDGSKQEKAEELPEGGLVAEQKPKKVQGGLLAIDPKTGQVRALVGGRDFQESEFDRMRQAKRQPGSAFKPFIYIAAIENVYTPSNILVDSPAAYYNDVINWKLLSNTTNLSDLDPAIVKKLDPEKIWIPHNYDDIYDGSITLRDALVYSKNACAIKLLDKIRPITAAYYAEKMGITTYIEKTLSMALGASEVLPIEITSAYCILANQGIKTKPYSIICVKDADGNILEENLPQEEEVLSPQSCYVLTHLLMEVCKYGTGKYTNLLRRPCAGKTGTTDECTDAWFIGFVPNLVCSVWVGYDDNTTLGDKQTGGVVAAPIWTDFMKAALANTPVLNFPVPNGITFVKIDTKTGLLSLEDNENTALEAYIKGTEPTKYSMK